MKHLVNIFFSEYKWYRKLVGGKWMRPFVDDPVCEFVWVEAPFWADLNCNQPLWRGVYGIENYE